MDTSRRCNAAPPEPYTSSQIVSYGDEIDVVALVGSLWRQRPLILTIVAITTVLGLLYGFVSRPDYQAEARLRPPTSADLRLLEARSPPLLVSSEKETPEIVTLYSAEPEEVFNLVVATAQSNTARRAVFEELATMLVAPETSAEDRSEALARFIDAFAISRQGAGQRDPDVEITLQVTFRHSDPIVAAKAANGLLRASSTAVSTEVVEEFRTALAARITSLRAELDRRISAARISTERTITRLLERDALTRAELEDELAAELRKTMQERSDRITALRAALATAQSLGIEQPTNLETMAAQGVASEANIVNLDPAGREEDLLFLRGTVLLKAELRGLESREDDKPYTARAREIEKQLQLLENNRTVESLRARENFAAFAPQAAEIEAEIEKLKDFLQRDFGALRVARVDQVATPPAQPVAPRKRIILAVAVLLGLMLGVFVALVRNAVLNRRESGPD